MRNRFKFYFNFFRNYGIHGWDESASYTQGRTINMTFNENAITVGDGGIRQLAREIRTELINLEQLGA